MVRKALLLLALIFFVGVSIGFVELGFRSVLGYEFPSWSPIQYLGAVFLVGLVYLVGEILWHPIGHVLVDTDKVTDALWKRSLLVLILILLGMLPIAAYILWRVSANG